MTKIALVFPGQGSQSIGMMAAYETLPAVRATFREASEILGQDLWTLVTEGPAEELNQTVNTQPIMLTAGFALLQAWKEAGGKEAVAVGGHSLGEYTALVASGALDFRDALPLVRLRAQLMQQAVPEGVGGIAAILGLDDEAVRAVCAEAAQGQVLEAANFNAPNQVVIAGDRDAVARGMELARAKGAKRAVALPMSAPSHCSLMRGAAEQLGQTLATIPLHAPRLPAINNVDVAAPSGAAEIRDALVRQLYRPVRWVECVQELARRGATTIIECGPGGVLTGLNRRISTQVEAVALKDAAQVSQLASEL
jgi:[acyl-carrier-protein] S-malonyltransferase